MRPLRKRDHCIGACIGYESGMHPGMHQVITLSVELGEGGLWRTPRCLRCVEFILYIMIISMHCYISSIYYVTLSHIISYHIISCYHIKWCGPQSSHSVGADVCAPPRGLRVARDPCHLRSVLAACRKKTTVV